MKSSPRSSGRFVLAAILAGAAVVAAAVVGTVALRGATEPPDQATTGPATKPVKPPKPDLIAAFFTTEPVPRLRIRIPAAGMQALRGNARGYVRTTVIDLPDPKDKSRRVGTAYGDVGVHLKGGAGSFRQVDDRPALTLSIDHFNKGQRFHGLDKLHLNNSVQDGSYLSEALGSAIFNSAGVPATRVSHAHVWLNDRDMGIYVLKEGFDHGFLHHFFPDPTGMLYEGPFLADVDGGVIPKLHIDPNDKVAFAAAKAKADARIKELVAAAREPDAAKRQARLDKVLDVDRFLTSAALEGMVAHWDGYTFHRNNYRIYDDPKTGKLVFLPHGMDQLFQDPNYPLFPSESMLAQALISTPEQKARHMERVAQLRETLFTPERLTKYVDDVETRLMPAMAQIGPDAVRAHQQQADEMKRRILSRIAVIDKMLGVQAKPLKFDKSGVAAVPAAKWEPGPPQGNAAADKAAEAGKPRLRVRCQNGGGNASWRQTVLLAKGRYVFEGQCRVSKVTAPDGPSTGAGLRVSGDTRAAKLTGTTAANGWQKVEYEFEVTDPTKEVVLVCELKATAGEVVFDPESLKLRRR